MSTGFNITTDMPLEEAANYFNNIPGRVSAALTAKGFAIGSTPPIVRDSANRDVPYNGTIPADLTKLDDNSLGWYLGLISGWLDYVNQQLAEAHGTMTVAVAKLAFIDAHLLMIHKKDIQNGDKKRPEAERKALVLTDRRYVEAQSESIYYETFYRHVKAIAESADQNYSAISRRISQRQQDIERQKRTTGVGNATNSFFQRP